LKEKGRYMFSHHFKFDDFDFFLFETSKGLKKGDIFPLTWKKRENNHQ